MFRNIDNYLVRKSRPFLILLSFVQVAVLGFIDYSVGSEISFSLFYIIPVLTATWYISRPAGVLISILAAVVWFSADFASGHVYSHVLVPFWNAGVRMSFFLVITLLTALVKQKLEMEETLADTDYLTGLKNSHSFHEHVEYETVRSRRSKRPFTLAYIDLDNFKFVNDTFGHDRGDELLQTVAKAIRDNVRQSDIISRQGGDEFAGLFPETDFRASETIIHNLVQLLNHTMNEKGWSVTFSIGSVTFIKPLDTVREMMKKVDDLMYSVKKSGKNNVVHIECSE